MFRQVRLQQGCFYISRGQRRTQGNVLYSKRTMFLHKLSKPCISVGSPTHSNKSAFYVLFFVLIRSDQRPAFPDV